MRKFTISLLLFLSLIGILLYFGYPILVQRLGLQGRAGLKIDSNPKSKVLVNNKDVGFTPYQDENLTEGEYLVTLESQDASASGQLKNAWQGYVRLNTGTLSVVNRDLSDSSTSSSGEIIVLEEGEGVTVVSTPSDSVVSIDGKERGRTPLTVSDLSPGEHQFIISHDNFLNRSIRANLVDGYNLKLSVDLALSEADLTKISAQPISQTQTVVVKKTPTGFLNVRETASTNGNIITKLKPGDELTLLEEVPNWDRIRTSDGKEGYVSSAYVEKKTQ